VWRQGPFEELKGSGIFLLFFLNLGEIYYSESPESAAWAVFSSPKKGEKCIVARFGFI
jgi:hypothetical protein